MQYVVLLFFVLYIPNGLLFRKLKMIGVVVMPFAPAQ
jgi:hypothetical protein